MERLYGRKCRASLRCATKDALHGLDCRCFAVVILRPYSETASNSEPVLLEIEVTNIAYITVLSMPRLVSAFYDEL